MKTFLFVLLMTPLMGFSKSSANSYLCKNSNHSMFIASFENVKLTDDAIIIKAKGVGQSVVKGQDAFIEGDSLYFGEIRVGNPLNIRTIDIEIKPNLSNGKMPLAVVSYDTADYTLMDLDPMECKVNPSKDEFQRTFAQ